MLKITRAIATPPPTVRCPFCAKGLLGGAPRGEFSLVCPRCKQPLMAKWVEPVDPRAVTATPSQ